jgi:hypothetical protein
MAMQRCAIAGLAIVLATSACGKSAEQKQAEQAVEQAAKTTQQAAKTAEQGASQAAKGLEQMAKGLEAMAGNAAANMNTKVTDPVSFRDLMTLFPDLDGWEKEKPTGERMNAPFAFSRAEVRYRKGDARVELKIVDSGFSQMFLAPYTMFLQAGYEKETSNGYEKSTTVNGQPGWEKWNTEGKDGELNALVGKRFLFTVEGRNVDDAKFLHQIAGKVDMAKLAAMK